MKELRNQPLFGLADRDTGETYSDFRFVGCTFSNCALSITSDPARRSTVRNIELEDTEVHACRIWSVIVDDVRITTLKTRGILQTWGAVFSKTVLRGRIGSVMFSAEIQAGLAPPGVQAAFESVNAEFYRGVDWALDIREAEFVECDLRGIPARLIRRDPATQVVVTREAALDEERWRSLNLSGTHWSTAIEMFLERGEPDVTLVAGRRDRKFRALADGLARLRDAGVAEPD
jgi:hypothetical protein